MKRILGIVLLLIVTGFYAFAQLDNPVKWSFEQKKLSDTEHELLFTATIKKGWHLYSDKLTAGGPIATSFNYDSYEGFEILGKVSATTKPVAVFDKTFNMDLEYFSNTVTFIQKIKVLAEKTIEVKGYVEYMSCDDEQCTPPDETAFSFSFNGAKPVQVSNVASLVQDVSQPEGSALDEEKMTTSINEDITAPDNKSESQKPAKRGLIVFLLISFSDDSHDSFILYAR